MICRISGTLIALHDTRAILEIEALQYEVLIPEFTRRQLQLKVGTKVGLHTIQYLEGNPAQGRLTPRLVGFLNEAEKEFFEMFCSVDGVGARKALRAMVRPVADVATMIEEQDAKGLSTLPGVGAATSERIIAKLRRKMPKFALIATSDTVESTDVDRDVVHDSYELLVSLGHSESDARKLIDAALGSKKKYKDVDTLIKEVYRISHEQR